MALLQDSTTHWWRRNAFQFFRFVAKAKSIWSLSVADDLSTSERLVTLEVNNKTKAIVQARGACNRKTKSQEDRVIVDWASKNGLAVSYGRDW